MQKRGVAVAGSGGWCEAGHAEVAARSVISNYLIAR